MGDRNRVGIGLPCRPVRLHRLAESTPWNQFLHYLKILKYRHRWCCVEEKESTRDYWMIYRGPGFLAVVWCGSFFTHIIPPFPPASRLSFYVFLCVASRVKLTDGRRWAGGRWWERAKTFDGEKIWSSIYHSILFEKFGPFSKYWDRSLIDDKT